MSGSMRLWLPKTFPLEAFDRYREFGRLALAEATDEHAAEFGASTENTVWRFRACWDYAGFYKEARSKLSTQEEIYQTQRQYFGIYNSCVSTVESLLYSMHALLASPALFNWPFTESNRKELLPAYLIRTLEEQPQNCANTEKLLRVLTELTKSKFWCECRAKRIRMFHRSVIPRLVYFGGGAPPGFSLPPTSNTAADEADAESVDSLLDWLSAALAVLVAAGISVIEDCDVGHITEPQPLQREPPQGCTNSVEGIQAKVTPLDGTLELVHNGHDDPPGV